MARDSRRLFLLELAKISPKLEQAFQEAIADIRSVSQLRLIEAAIERGDIEGVFQAMRLGAEFFAPLDRSIQDAFEQGAIWQLSTLPKKPSRNTGPLVVRFQGRNPRAEAWTRQEAGSLITEILTGTRDAVRDAISDGLEQNRGIRSVALDLVGRMDGNRRKGGIIGLHSRQARAVQRARAELVSPDTMAEYLRRKTRDRRFDRTITKAIREGKQLTPKAIDQITGRYADRLLALRGRTIARTETLKAFSAGRNEGIMQLVETGRVPADAVKLIWQSTPSDRTRDTHLVMHGQEVALGEAFTSPSGARMAFPGDTSLGAPGEETINCRCGVRTKIDFVRLAV